MTAWIKVRVDLWWDCRVVRLAKILGIERASVVGRLMLLWSIADGQTVDGVLIGYTASSIDEDCDLQGFANALVDVGWLVVRNDGVVLPNFTEHNGESAKKRGQAGKRMQKSRSGKRDADQETGCAPSVTTAQRKAQPDRDRDPEEDPGSDHLDLSFLREEAIKIASVVGPEDDDARAGIKRVCVLAVTGRISEHCLRDALEAVKRAGHVDDRARYFFAMLAYGKFCENRNPSATTKAEARRKFAGLLKTVKLPPELVEVELDPPIRTPRRPAGEPKSIGSILLSTENQVAGEGCFAPARHANGETVTLAHRS